jgi:hypothetical protein
LQVTQVNDLAHLAQDIQKFEILQLALVTQANNIVHLMQDAQDSCFNLVQDKQDLDFVYLAI